MAATTARVDDGSRSSLDSPSSVLCFERTLSLADDIAACSSAVSGVDEESDENVCPVCFVEIGPDAALNSLTTSCGHKYCAPCLVTLTARSCACPLCRSLVHAGDCPDECPLCAAGVAKAVPLAVVPHQTHAEEISLARRRRCSLGLGLIFMVLFTTSMLVCFPTRRPKHHPLREALACDPGLVNSTAGPETVGDGCHQATHICWRRTV